MLKKFLKGMLGLALVLASLLSPNNLGVIHAEDDSFISSDGNDLIIGNSLLSRKLTVENGKIKTSQINNQMANKTIVPQTGSEDFVVSTIAKEEIDGDIVTTNPTSALNSGNNVSEWTATIKNKNGVAFPDAQVSKLFNYTIPNTSESSRVNNDLNTGYPFNVDIDLKQNVDVGAISVLKRAGYTDAAYGKNGTPGDYELYVSDDNENWTFAGSGKFTAADYNLHKEGTLYNVGDTVYANLDQVYNTRYVRFKALNDVFGGTQEFTLSRMNVYTDQKRLEVVKEFNAIKIDTTGASATYVDGNNGAPANVSAANLKNLLDYEQYTDFSMNTKYPYSLTINLGSEQTIGSFDFLKRNGFYIDGYGKNGTPKNIKLEVSSDGTTWTEVKAKTLQESDFELYNADGKNGSGTVQFLYNLAKPIHFDLDKTYQASYLRFTATDALWASTDVNYKNELIFGGLNFYQDRAVRYPYVPKQNVKINASDLDYDSYTTADIDGGKQLTIKYKPIVVNGVTYNFNNVYEVYDNEHYMRSYLKVNVDKPNEAVIDYIDMDAFKLDGSVENIWSHPPVSDVSSMWIGASELVLGQPIYANGMFFGNEFPSADTDMIDATNTMQIRYYTGKSFTQFKQDGQLDANNTFKTWSNVIGVAPSTDNDVVQTYFYDYINDIATKTKFRIQYNSWYDNMMGITDESIAKSFLGSEKGLAQNGVRPLDSYVVDDGWNNYNGTSIVSESSSGSELNRTGFWEFNSKFPNELYTSSALTGKLGSPFGLWLGPQGGYNFFGSFATYLQSQGTGFETNDFWKSIDVASDRYIKNLTKLFVDYQDRFGITYWKLDGFAARPAGTVGNEHMVGGPNNRYSTTDQWEKWTRAFEEMRANSPTGEPEDIFINATCYVNLSPWLLQYVNTIWIQDSGDTGNTAGAKYGSRYQGKITYRDQVYYKLLKRNELQFPLKNLYNHDPIYGVSDGSDATTEDFRDYLMINAARGTAFWELYYSPSLMNEAKWEVNADVLSFVEANAHILEKAKMFGNEPEKGIYGYSGWDQNEGIVTFRNPLDVEATYSLVLNDVVGVPANLAANLKEIQVHPYVGGLTGKTIQYGDTVTVTLKPHETRMYQYGLQDQMAPKMTSAKVTGVNEVTLKFDERINLDTTNLNAIQVDDKDAITIKVKDDYRTVVVTSADVIQTKDGSNLVDVKVDQVKDSNGNMYSGSVAINGYTNNVITNIENPKEDLKNGSALASNYDANRDVFYTGLNNKYQVNTENSIQGTTDFTIMMDIKTTSLNTKLYDQGDVSLMIDANGFVKFTVKGQTVSSEETVTTVSEKAKGTFNTPAYEPTQIEETIKGAIADDMTHSIAAVREVNGLLKLYIDGKLSASSYDETKVNELITKQSVYVGDSGIDAVLGNFKVLNKALGYDEIAAAATQEEMSKIVANRDGWVASANSEQPATGSDGPASYAIDGNTNTQWHSKYSDSLNSYEFTINFNKEETFDEVRYLGRPSGSNGSIKDYKMEAEIDGVWTEIKTGTFEKNVENFIALDAAVTATGLRITSLSTFNGQKYAAIVELNIAMSDRDTTEAEKEEVRALYPPLAEADAKKYSTLTFEAYDEYTKKVEALKIATKYNLNKFVEAVQEAKDALVNIEALTAAIDTSEATYTSSKLGENTPLSIAAYEAALANAKAVTATATSDSEVSAAIDALAQAEANLVDAKDLKTLIAVVDVMNITVDAIYTPATATVLKDTLAAAKTALEEATTKAQVDAITSDLQAAVDQLVVRVTTANKDAVAAIETEMNSLDKSDYVTQSWDAVAAKLATVKALIADENTPNVEVSTWLQDNANLLDTLLDAKELKAAITQAEAVDKTLYTPKTIAALETALTAAKQAKEEATTPAAVEVARKALKDATDALVLAATSPEKAALQTAVDDLKKYDQDAYTVPTYKALVDAVETAKAKLADPNLTSEEAKTLLKDIETKEKALEAQEYINRIVADDNETIFEGKFKKETIGKALAITDTAKIKVITDMAINKDAALKDYKASFATDLKLVNPDLSDAQLFGTVKVKMKYSKAWDNHDIKIVHYVNDQVTIHEVKVEDGYIVFDVDHFSDFVVLTKATTNPVNPVKPDKDTTPGSDTGDTTNTAMLFTCLLVAGFVIVRMRKQMNK